MKENTQLKIYDLSEIKNLKVHGRTSENRSPLTLFWTGSGIELNVKGTELWMEVEVDYDMYEQWINVVINSVPITRQMLPTGRYWVCIFRGMNESVIKNVKILKEVQAMSADPKCSFQIHKVKFDGEFLPVGDRPLKIEFIGDSITSGEGAIGAKEEEEWIPMWFSAVQNYTYLTAEKLHADYRVISQSGWGVLTSWDNNPNANIPKYYEQVCGVLVGDKNERLGAFKQNDFHSWQPDAVVVNLGTNDGGAFHSSAWLDEQTGETYKQRLNDDGSYNLKDLEKFVQAVEAFLDKLRKYNPNSHIVWAYGMLGIPMMPAIYQGVEAYKKRTGDKKVSVFQLPNMTEETVGARSHPGIKAHEETAKALSEYLNPLLKGY